VVRDRVVQAAVKTVIEPIFEREFCAQSYGFRPGRSCCDALRRVDELLKSGHVHVVDIDSILRKRRKLNGRARGSDRLRWKNCYIAELGLFSLKQTQAKAIARLRNGVTC